MINIILNHLKEDSPIQFTYRVLRYFVASINDVNKYINIFIHRIQHGNNETNIRIGDNIMSLSLKDKGISQGLIGYRLWEQRASEIISNIVTKDMIVMDIGANMGYFAMLESRFAKKVYAIEPVEVNYNLLNRNIALNSIRNISTYNYAVGSENKTGEIYLSERNNCGSMIYRGSINKHETSKVQIITVDEFLKGKASPSLIRMDVEGYEYQIILGMQELLSSRVPLMLFIELHPKYLGDDLLKMINILKYNGFRCALATDREIETNSKTIQYIYYSLSDKINADKGSHNGYYFMDTDLDVLTAFKGKEVYPHVLFKRY